MKFFFVLRNFFYFLNKTALHVAVEEGNIKMVKLLVKHKGINGNIKDNIFNLYD